MSTMMIQGLTDDQQRRAWDVIRPWLAVMLRTAQCLTRRDQDAEDLVQETVIKAMRAIDTFHAGTDEKAWLLTIMRRAHVDTIRKSHRQVDTLSLDAGDGIDATAPSTAAGEHDHQWERPDDMMEQFADQQVIDELRELPDDIRWTLLLVDVEGLGVADAAKALGVPPGTVKSRCHRGRAMLRDRLYAFAQSHGMIPKGKLQ